MVDGSSKLAVAYACHKNQRSRQEDRHLAIRDMQTLFGDKVRVSIDDVLIE